MVTEEEKFTMILQKEDLMVAPTGESIPTMRQAYFLKPIINPKQQSLPKHPFHSLSSNPNNTANSISELRKMVTFRGRSPPQKGWKSWIDDLQKTHQSIWKKVGIFDAIRASTYKILKDDKLVVALAERWCVETNTFVFPWGEATVTLEDVMVLGGFSALGVSVTDISSKDRNFMEIEAKLKDGISEIRDNIGYAVSHDQFMKYFLGIGGEIEHVAFLVLWLSRYVFPKGQFINRNSCVIPIAISLARGTKVALAPAVLASIYRDLSLLKEKIETWTKLGRKFFNSNEIFHLWGPAQSVQLWAWERLQMLAPKPGALRPGEPRLARWHRVRSVYVGDLRVVLKSAGDDFLWRPYTMHLENWKLPEFYCNEEMWVLLNSEIDDELLSFAKCLRSCELVGIDCVEKYLPHRVGMQFGFDQDIPDSVTTPECCHQPDWSDCDKMPDGSKLYFPHRSMEGDVTMQYLDWWRDSLALKDAVKVYERRRKGEKEWPVLYMSKMGLDLLECNTVTPMKTLASSDDIWADGMVNLMAESVEKGGKRKRFPATGKKGALVDVNNAVRSVEEDRVTQICQSELGRISAPATPSPFGEVRALTIEASYEGIPSHGVISEPRPPAAISLENMKMSKGAAVHEDVLVKVADRSMEGEIHGVKANFCQIGSAQACIEGASFKEPENQLNPSIAEDQQGRVDNQVAANHADDPAANSVVISDDEEATSPAEDFFTWVYELESRASRSERKLSLIKAARAMDLTI